MDAIKKRLEEILRGTASSVGRQVQQGIARGQTSGRALSQGKIPQTRDVIPFQQQRAQIGQGLTNTTRSAVQPAVNYFDPTKSTNQRPGFWSDRNPVAQFMAKPQNYRIPIASTFKATPKDNLGSQIGAGLQNLGLTIADETINLPQRFLEGGNKFASIKRDNAWDDKARVVNATASVALPFLDTVTLGGGTLLKGVGKQAIKEIGKQTFKQTVARGAGTGTAYGAVFGGLRGLSEGEKAEIGNFAEGLIGGAALGMGFGAGVATAGRVIGTLFQTVKRQFPKASDKEVSKKVVEYSRDRLGRFTGFKKDNQPWKASGGDMVDPKAPPKINHWMDNIDRDLGIDNINSQGGFAKFDEFLPNKIKIKDSQSQSPVTGNQQKIKIAKSGKTTNDPLFSGGMNQANLPPTQQGGMQLPLTRHQSQSLQSTSPYGGSIAQDTREVLTGTPVKERGFVSTVKLSPKTPQKIKDMVSGSYVVKNNTQLRADARELIKTNPVAAEQVALNPTADVHIQIGNELIEYYGSRGNFRKATEIAEGMANSGTELGRAVQAFSNYDKTSPQGVVRFAQQTVNAYNRKNPQKKLNITDKQIESLFNRARKIQNMPEGRNRNIASYQLMEEVNNLIPSSIADKLVTVWKAGLLTSLRTQERNILGNTVHGLAEVAKDIPASVADRIMALRTGQRSTVFTTKGTLGGLKEGFKSGKDILTKGYDPEDVINKYDVRRITWGNNKVEQALKIYTNVIFRSLGASDKPAWNAAFARSLYNQAQTQAINAGKKGNKTFVEKLVKKPTTEMLGVATKDANIAVFKDSTQLGKLARGIQDFKIGGAPVGQILAPFTGVPSNIAVQMFEYSPLGLIRGASTMTRVLAKNVPELQRQAAQEVGRGVMGTGLMGLGSYLMSQGLMTGQPKDAKEYAQWQVEGKMPNSVLINGKWRSVNSIGPEFLIVLAGAKLQEELSDPEGSMGRYAGNVGKDFLGQTFLQGVQGPLQAVNDPDRYASSYLGQQGSSIVPNIVRDTAKAFDSKQRENNSIQDYFLNSLPGLRNQTTVKRDALGNPMKQEPSGLSAYYDLFNSKTPVTGNNVVDELSRLNNAGYNATPSKLQKKQTINGKEMELTPDQLDTLEAETGILVRDSLNKLISGKYYQSLSDEEKKDAISDTVTNARKEAKKGIDLDLKAKIKATFESKPEDPQNILDKVLLASRGVIVDPGNTIKAIFTEEELRKIEGNAVILKRKENLNQLDNKNLHVDHIIPLGMGGDNSPENLQVVEKEVKKSKDKLEKELIRKLQNGEITRQEAQKQIKEWSANNPIGVPLSEFSSQKQTSLIESSDIDDDTEDYILTDEGEKVDISPPSKGQGIGAFVNQDWNITKAREVWNNDAISHEEKNKAFEKLGVKAEDVRYDALANYTNDIKAQYIASKNFDHDKLIAELEKGRIPSISGKIMAADGVLDDLYEEGLISAAERKYLKDLDYNKDGTLKKGSGKKAKAVGAVPKLQITTPQAPQLTRLNINVGGGQKISIAPPKSRRIPIKAPSVRDTAKRFRQII